jgi:hypothetical protein
MGLAAAVLDVTALLAGALDVLGAWLVATAGGKVLALRKAAALRSPAWG